jgi:hypothetical protein
MKTCNKYNDFCGLQRLGEGSFVEKVEFLRVFASFFAGVQVARGRDSMNYLLLNF